MSKRYGRNQKRAARKRIEYLELKCDRNQELIEKISRRKREYKRSVIMTIDVLGRYFSTIPDNEKGSLEISKIMDYLEIDITRTNPDCYNFKEGPNKDDLLMTVLRLIKMTPELEFHRNKLEESMIVRAKTGAGKHSLFVSERALSMHSANELSELIADDLKHALINELKKKYS